MPTIEIETNKIRLARDLHAIFYEIAVLSTALSIRIPPPWHSLNAEQQKFWMDFAEMFIAKLIYSTAYPTEN